MAPSVYFIEDNVGYSLTFSFGRFYSIFHSKYTLKITHCHSQGREKKADQPTASPSYTQYSIINMAAIENYSQLERQGGGRETIFTPRPSS